MPFCRVVFASALAVHLLVATCFADGVIGVPAITCADSASERVPLRSTDRLPEASGAITVERMGGMTEIEVKLDSMKPASLFGGDYNTYVLWVVPPGGAAENLGEIALDGSHGKVQVSTGATSFALLITAEPHYLVSSPSAFVVLENKRMGHPTVQYRVLEGVYN